MNELEFIISEILGRSALDNDMEIPEYIQKLARAARYLGAQLTLICMNECGDKEVSLPILKEAVKILK